MMTGMLPSPSWIAAYQRPWLRRDLVAGITAAAVVIPQAMAYATVAGLPVEVGLYCAFVPMVAYGLVGSSRPLSVSTTSTISIITAATLATVQGDPLTVASTLAVLVGVVLLAAGLLRLGFVADFISDSTLAGFKAGMGLVVIVDQLGRVLGVTVTGDNFFEKAWSALRQLPDASATTVALAVTSIVALLLLARLAPALPASLLVVAAGIGAVALLNLDQHGVALISPVPRGLPGFSAPELGLIGDLLPAALGIAIMVFTESIAAARAFRKREDSPVDADRELLALGIANVGGGLFQAYPAGGGLSQTAVNDRAGARSQLAGLVTAGGVILTLLVLAPIFDDLALATLGAIVIVAAIGLITSPELARMRRLRARDFDLALVALAGVLLFGTLQGVFVAVIVSLVVLVHQANRPPIVTLGRDRESGAFRDHALHPQDEVFEGLLVLRVDGALYFINARRVFTRIVELVDSMEGAPGVLLLDCSSVPDVDVTAIGAANDFVGQLHDRGAQLWLASVHQRPRTMLQRADHFDRLEREGRSFASVRLAVDHYLTDTRS
jgi:SulP family sulfate permease